MLTSQYEGCRNTAMKSKIFFKQFLKYMSLQKHHQSVTQIGDLKGDFSNTNPSERLTPHPSFAFREQPLHLSFLATGIVGDTVAAKD